MVVFIYKFELYSLDGGTYFIEQYDLQEGGDRLRQEVNSAELGIFKDKDIFT